MIDAQKTIERARRILGAPVASVEITDEQFTSLLKDAHESFYLYSELSELSQEKIDNIADNWTKKYFYALCKENLARIRGKFGGILPIPGGELTLNYKELLNESEQEKKFLQYLIFKDSAILMQSVKPIIVVYLKMPEYYTEEDCQQYIHEFSSKFKPDDSVTRYLIPIHSGQTRIECIYPNNNGKEIIELYESFIKNLENEK